MSLVVAMFQIPITEDGTVGSGRRHPTFRWKSLENALYEHFGGWTRLPGETSGMWKDRMTGEPARDRCRWFQVDLDSARVEDLRELLRRACVTFVQQEIRVVVDGKPEYIKGSPSHDPL